MANPPKQEPASGGGFFKSLTGGQNQQRLLEQTIVAWEDDDTVVQCPFCQYPSTSFIFLSLDNNSIFPIENIIVDCAVELCVDNLSHTAPRTLVSMSLGVFSCKGSH